MSPKPVYGQLPVCRRFAPESRFVLPQRRFPMPESPPEGAWDLCVCWVPQGQILSSMTKRDIVFDAQA